MESSVITVTVCGGSDSGKTSLMRRYLENQFEDEKKESYTSQVCFYLIKQSNHNLIINNRILII